MCVGVSVSVCVCVQWMSDTASVCRNLSSLLAGCVLLFGPGCVLVLLLTAALYPLADTFTTKSDSFIQNCITYTVYTERFGLVGGVDEGHPCIQHFDHTCTARSLARVPGFCSLCFYLFHHL